MSKKNQNGLLEQLQEAYQSTFGQLNRFRGVFSNDIGIDLGTANTLVFVRGKGIVLAEPSVVAVDSLTNEVLAVGHKAKAMLGKTPRKIHAVRPMKDGVIADFEIAEGMLKALIKRVTPARSLFRPKILIAVPSGITGVEKRAVEEGIINAGVYIIDRNKFLSLQLPQKFSMEKDYMERYFSTHPFYAFEFSGYFIDIGIPEDYEKVQVDFL